MLAASIGAASSSIKSRSTTVTTLASAAYKKALALNPVLNSFITLNDPCDVAKTLDDQLNQAENNGQLDVNNNDSNQLIESPLYGIPVAIKDNFHLSGCKTTCASRVLADFNSTIDATVSSKLKKSGAVILGKTNMDEFAIGSANVDSFYGPCVNPLSPGLKSKLGIDITSDTVDCKVEALSRETLEQSDEFLIPGGSSGGSAAAVASGCVYGAIGSDTGGSTRQPAALNGIVGFKPTYGVISRYGLVPLSHSLDTVGVMARNVPDTKILFDAIRGYDEKDSTSQNITLTRQRFGDSGIVIGIPSEFESFNMDSSVNQLWHSIASKIASDMKGLVSVVKVSIPHLTYCQACYCVLNSCEIGSNFACYDGIEYGYTQRVKSQASSPSSSTASVSSSWHESLIETRANSFGDAVKGRILSGNYFLLDENVPKYLEPAYRLRRLILEDTLNVLHSVDFILAPATPGPASPINKWINLDDDKQTQRQAASRADSFLHLANLTGIPSIVIPVGETKDKSNHQLPLSLQLCSAPFRDLDLLDFAETVSLMFESSVKK